MNLAFHMISSTSIDSSQFSLIKKSRPDDAVFEALAATERPALEGEVLDDEENI